MADDEAAQLTGVESVGRPVGDDRAVPEHRDRVSQREDLVKPVGDVQDRLAVRREPAQGIEQTIGLRRCQAGCGLVEYEGAVVCSVTSPNSSGDRDQRSVRGPQTGERYARRDLHPEALENRRGLSIEPAPVDPAGST